MSLVASERTGRMTHFQFRVAVFSLMHSTDRWLLPFEPQWLLRTIDPQNLLKARPEQIAHIRDAFLHPELGFFIHGRFMGHPGLEISEEFRRDTGNEARQPDPQRELPLAGGLASLPPANQAKDEVRKRRPGPAGGIKPATPDSGLRRESEQSKAPESPRARGDLTTDGHGCGKTRGRGPGKESFARWVDDKPDDALWARLCVFLGRAEMTQNGDMWLKRLFMRRDLIETLLGELERQGTGGVENVGAWFNAIYEERRKLWA